MSFFDPDRQFFTMDKLQHAAFGAGITLVALALGFGPLWSFLAVLALGITYELGQWDVARHFMSRMHPGFGFGLLDLLADLIGGAIPIAVYCYLSFTPLPSHPKHHDPHGFTPEDRWTHVHRQRSGVDQSPTTRTFSFQHSLSPQFPAAPNGVPLARV